MHVMIDIETLGTRPDAAILQVGIATFHLDASGNRLGDINGWLVDIGSALSLGASVDPDTLAWWQAQPAELRRTVFEGGARLHIEEMLDKIERFVDGQHEEWAAFGEIEGYWSHGAGFDLAILDWYSRRLRGTPFVPYKLARDTRTLWWMARAIGWTPEPRDAALTLHNATADATAQALDVISAYEALERARAAPTAHSPLPTAGEPVAL